MTQRFIAITDNGPTVQWLQNALENIGVVMHAEKRSLSDVAALVDIASASVVFVSLSHGSLVQATAFIEGLLAAKPMLSVIAVGEGMENDIVLGAMRAGARDYIVYGARSSEVSDIVRRVNERMPVSATSTVEHGQMMALASPRPDAQAAFLIFNMAVALKEREPDASILVLDIGVPNGDVLANLDIPSSFSFSDALRSLKRMDSTLIDSAFPRYRPGIRILSAPPEGLDLSETSSAEIFLLLGSLRTHFTHILVNVCGTVDQHLVSIVIGNSDTVIFVVEQTIVSCKQTLEMLRRLKKDGVPCERQFLLIDHYYQSISPDRSEIEESLGCPVVAAIPAAPETRLRVSNLGKSIFELDPKDFLAKKLRQMVDDIFSDGVRKEPSVRDRLFGMIGRKEA